MTHIVLIGPPGAGKGTEAALLEEQFGFLHISTGNLLRQEITQETTLGKRIKEKLAAGEFVSDELILEIIKHPLLNNKNVVLDGCPRTITQAEILEKMLEHHGKKIDYVIEIKLEDAVILKRLSERFVCKKCGSTYHKTFKPLKKQGFCDECGDHQFLRRPDDDPHIIKKRLTTYYEVTAPICDFYKDRSLLYVVDGNRSIELVHAQVAAILENSSLTFAKNTV